MISDIENNTRTNCDHETVAARFGRSIFAAMISVIIPTLNAERGLAATLGALVPAAVSGLVREVIIVDGGSEDRTAAIAEDAGATFLRTEAGRGNQMRGGAEVARCEWLLFLHADTVLEQGWEREVSALIDRVETGARPETAAAFQFALDDVGARPRLLEAIVALRCATLRLPYGDQGLLLRRRLYERVAGYRPLPLMEDIDIVRRIGRRRIVLLRSKAVTSAVRYKREGYLQRAARNTACLALFYMRAPPRMIERIYQGGSGA
jgi:rSAM/selenodomain-associated transferase 2